ncbi:MAG: DUF805 domain-containing protein [Hyphomicrobiales bacterium]|nr:DUF805 domain-containing protein [Hyphomicrobiales bacterium]
MSFAEAIKNNFSKYVTFSGRARRSEFWLWILFTFIANIILGGIDIALFGTVTVGAGSFSAHTNFAPFSGIFSLVVLLPTISVGVRRLHDTDRSGWWWWLSLIPLVGIIILIVWWATEGTRGANRYGEDPLAGERT